MLDANFDLRELIKEFIANNWEKNRQFCNSVFLGLAVAYNYQILFIKNKAAVKIITEPGIKAAIVKDVENTVVEFEKFNKEAFSVNSPDGIRMFLCPDRQSYVGIFQREFGQSFEVATRNSNLTGGYFRGASGKVAINFDTSTMESLQRCIYNYTTHELFHLVQYQLAGDKLDSSYYWLKEGSADFVGAVIAEKMGRQSFESWRLEQLNTVRFASRHALPKEIFHTNLSKWTNLIEEKMSV